MKIIVTGGRDFNHESTVISALNLVHNTRPISLLAEGGAAGADRLAREWRNMRRVPGTTYPALWGQCDENCTHEKREKYGRNYCPAAGPRRNIDMYMHVRPDIIVAFPGGRGTLHMTNFAFQNATPVIKFHAEGMFGLTWTVVGTQRFYPDLTFLLDL